MRLRILRAANEIGGNCVQVEAHGQSLLLDLGLPLNAPRADADLLPPVPGLAAGTDKSLLGIVLSHPHQDHYGLLCCVHPAVPVYLGEGARRLLEAASFFTSGASIPQTITSYRSFEKFSVGPFEITPLLVDHSAFDAHALLVEAEGKTVLYSGDFRAHGRKSALMERLIHNPPKGIDVLLMEGTTLGREGDELSLTEQVLEDAVVSSIRQTEGLVLAQFSAQNIDRLVTFYRAAIRTQRQLVIDVYTACLLDALGRTSLPSAGAKNVRVFLPKRQKLQIVRAKRFDKVLPYRLQRIYGEEIAANPERWVMLFRDSMMSDLEAVGCCARGKLIYSLWSGYLERGQKDLKAWARQQGMAFEIRHTSGHAHVEDLQRFVHRIAPKRLIPMHTQYPERYAALFPRVHILPNEIWFQL